MTTRPMFLDYYVVISFFYAVVFRENLVATCTHDRRLWIWIYPWVSTENLWIWVLMANFISTANLPLPVEGSIYYTKRKKIYCKG